jgi:hypothetical protein
MDLDARIAMMESSGREFSSGHKHTKLIATNKVKNLQDYPYLVELDISNNTSIKDLSYLTRLKKLVARDRCALIRKGLRGLSLTELDISRNPDITELPDLPTLTKLDASGSRCGLSNLKGLTNLVELNIDHNVKIEDLSHLTKLTKLSAKATQIEDLSRLTQLTHLDISDTDRPINISTLAKLVWLDVSASALSDRDLRGLSPIYLDISYADNIRDLSTMTSVEILKADGDTLSQEGLPPNVRNLSIEDNDNIVDTSHLPYLEDVTR